MSCSEDWFQRIGGEYRSGAMPSPPTNPSRFVMIHLLSRIFKRTATDAEFRLFLVEIRGYLSGSSVLRQLCHAAAHSSGLAPIDKSHREYIHGLLSIILYFEVSKNAFDPHTLSHDFMKYTSAWSKNKYKKQLESIYKRSKKDGLWRLNKNKKIPQEIYADVYKNMGIKSLLESDIADEVAGAIKAVVPDFPYNLTDYPEIVNDISVAIVAIVNSLSHTLPWGGDAHFNAHFASDKVHLAIGLTPDKLKFTIYMSILVVSVTENISDGKVQPIMWKSVGSTRTPPLCLIRSDDLSLKIVNNISHSHQELQKMRHSLGL